MQNLFYDIVEEISAWVGPDNRIFRATCKVFSLARPRFKESIPMLVYKHYEARDYKLGNFYYGILQEKYPLTHTTELRDKVPQDCKRFVHVIPIRILVKNLAVNPENDAQKTDYLFPNVLLEKIIQEKSDGIWEPLCEGDLRKILRYFSARKSCADNGSRLYELLTVIIINGDLVDIFSDALILNSWIYMERRERHFNALLLAASIMNRQGIFQLIYKRQKKSLDARFVKKYLPKWEKASKHNPVKRSVLKALYPYLEFEMMGYYRPSMWEFLSNHLRRRWYQK